MVDAIERPAWRDGGNVDSLCDNEKFDGIIIEFIHIDSGVYQRFLNSLLMYLMRQFKLSIPRYFHAFPLCGKVFYN